jgi:hypothetical protein
MEIHIKSYIWNTIKVMQKLYFLVLGVVFSSVLKAQDHKNIPGVNDCIGKNFSVVAWVLHDTIGQANMTQTDVQTAIDDLNGPFADICVSFNLCQYNELPNARQSKTRQDIEDKEIATIHQVKNVINIYFVEEVIADASQTIAQQGDTILPDLNDPLTNAIFIPKGSATDGATIMYALGRYFGLNYTHFGGDELADASNCATAGDKICDTPADPGGSSTNCHLYYHPTSPSLDANGHYYVPDVCNFMSWYTPSCRSSFTNEQYNVMSEVILKGRNYLW